jgi:hypothetical protein
MSKGKVLCGAMINIEYLRTYVLTSNILVRLGFPALDTSHPLR